MILRRDPARFDPVTTYRFDKTDETHLLIWAGRVEDIPREKTTELFSPIHHALPLLSLQTEGPKNPRYLGAWFVLDTEPLHGALMAQNVAFNPVSTCHSRRSATLTARAHQIARSNWLHILY